jgi:hypothetical protein
MAKDHSYRQTYRMWGPLPLRGPQGEAPGYVVLTEQPVPPGSLTVERHIIPGIGLVKEIIVQALRGEMLSRQELILTGVRRP